jgi:DNA-binding transcriptional regulator/RsmH inhibitor MraZ
MFLPRQSLLVTEAVEHLDERGRVTVKSAFRDVLKDGYVQVLTPDGVLFRRVSKRPLRTKAPALDNVDDEASKGL